MKKYKVLQVNTAEALELSLNEHAQNGWKVITANFAIQGDENIYFALLKNQSIEEEIKTLLEENINEIDSGLTPSAN